MVSTARTTVNGYRSKNAPYVDDLIISGDIDEKIIKLKEHLNAHFHNKDLENLKYFSGHRGIPIKTRNFYFSMKVCPRHIS